MAGERMSRIVLILLVIGLALLSPSLGEAYAFRLSEVEFRSWPAYCKVAYVRTNIGRKTTYHSLIPDNENVIGSSALASHPPFGEGGVHHLCAGMKWLERARIETQEQQRELYLTRARSEIQYTLERANPGSWVFTLASTQMAIVLIENGQESAALELIGKAIAAAPSEPDLYVSKAIIHYKQQRFALARDALIEGDKIVAGESADIHYNLGLVYLKLGDHNDAAERAYQAYKLGYPLPGLRRQLKRLGYWNPPE